MEPLVEKEFGSNVSRWARREFPQSPVFGNSAKVWQIIDPWRAICLGLLIPPGRIALNRQ
jgi:hypothetical protein